MNRTLYSRKSSLPRAQLMAVAVSTCFTASAWALPTAPNVANGTATFNQSGNVLTVTNSNGAIINWNTFSIGAGETTRFIQSSSSSSVLNRVLSSDPSVIYGALTSNGKVWLINPNGILVGPGARVDTAGFVASVLNISDSNFLAGKFLFNAGTGATGSVINQGTITTPSGGSVYLVGPEVQNGGIITTPQGETILAAGKSVQLIDTGTPGVKVEITGAEGNVTNLGTIVAEAGRIGMAGVLVKNSGTLDASSVVSDGGRIFLKASQDAYVDGDGRIVTTGTKGGQIEVLGNRVAVAGNASLNASGQSGGGSVLVGGDYQGKNAAIKNADYTYVGANATIKADATVNGNGGKAIVWGNKVTRALGSISAKGGQLGGNGGFIETSSHGYLDTATLLVNASAAHGKAGTWFLDPSDLTITHGAASTGGLTESPSGYFYGDSNATSSITDGKINAMLNAGTSVTVTTYGSGAGAGDLTVKSGVDIANTTGYGGEYLRLWADRDLTVESGAKIGVNSTVALNIDMRAGWNAYGGTTSTTGGNLTVNGAVKAYGGNLYLDAFDSTGTRGDITIASGATLKGNYISLDADRNLTIAGSVESDTNLWLYAGDGYYGGDVNITGSLKATDGDLGIYAYRGNSLTAGNITIASGATVKSGWNLLMEADRNVTIGGKVNGGLMAPENNDTYLDIRADDGNITLQDGAEVTTGGYWLGLRAWGDVSNTNTGNIYIGKNAKVATTGQYGCCGTSGNYSYANDIYSAIDIMAARNVDISGNISAKYNKIHIAAGAYPGDTPYISGGYPTNIYPYTSSYGGSITINQGATITADDTTIKNWSYWGYTPGGGVDLIAVSGNVTIAGTVHGAGTTVISAEDWLGLGPSAAGNIFFKNGGKVTAVGAGGYDGFVGAYAYYQIANGAQTATADIVADRVELMTYRGSDGSAPSINVNTSAAKSIYAVADDWHDSSYYGGIKIRNLGDQPSDAVSLYDYSPAGGDIKFYNSGDLSFGYYGGGSFYASTYGGLSIASGGSLSIYGGTVHQAGFYPNSVVNTQSYGGSFNAYIGYGGGLTLAAGNDLALTDFNATANTISLSAGRDITLLGAYMASQGNFDVLAGRNIGLGYSLLGAGAGKYSSGTGSLSIVALGNIDTEYAMLGAAGGNLTLHAGGGISLTGKYAGAQGYLDGDGNLQGGKATIVAESGSLVMNGSIVAANGGIQVLAGNNVELTNSVLTTTPYFGRAGGVTGASGPLPPADISILAGGSVILESPEVQVTAEVPGYYGESAIAATGNVSITLAGSDSKVVLNSQAGLAPSMIVSGLGSETGGKTNVFFLGRSEGGFIVDGVDMPAKTGETMIGTSGSGFYVGTYSMAPLSVSAASAPWTPAVVGTDMIVKYGVKDPAVTAALDKFFDDLGGKKKDDEKKNKDQNSDQQTQKGEENDASCT